MYLHTCLIAHHSINTAHQ